MPELKKMKKELVGRVVSDKMKDTFIFVFERREKHPKFQKFISRSTRYKAHDPGNTAKDGDLVKCRECHPLSKSKRWKLVAILEKAQ